MRTTNSAVLCALLLLFANEQTNAQATANAITSAQDAFGTSEGAESVGIYDQTSVRGFNLESAGNYRINGRYFVKNSGVSSFFLERTTVRIGYNALSLEHPGPSGVVDYKLRDPVRGEPSQVTAGVDSYEQPYAEAHFKYRHPDNSFSSSIGASRVFEWSDEQGGVGRNVLFAGTARLTPSDHTRLQVFGGEYRYARSGRFRISLAPDAEVLPNEIPRGRYLGQSWATEEGARRIFGGLADLDLAGDWSVRAIGVFAQEDPDNKYTQLFSNVSKNGAAESTVIASPAQRSTSYSGEVTLARTLRTGSITHVIAVNGRWRESTSRFGGERLIDGGTVLLGRPAPTLDEPAPDGSRATLHDRVDQQAAGLSYRATIADRLTLNTGMLYTDYAKRFTDATGVSTSRASAPWLYSFGTSLAVAGNLQLYGSYTRGLEEAGTAPATASNANTVLEATLATQKELGIRYALPNGMRLILAGFETRKPQVGIDPHTSAFGFIGDVTHRGIETSFSGVLGANLTAIAGGVYMRPQVSGAGVESGMIGERPVGVPLWRAIANLNYQATPRMSLDMGVEYVGEHAARSTLIPSRGRQLDVPSAVIIDLGARYRMDLGDQAFIIRAQLLNALDEFGWRTAPGETLEYLPQRSLRVLVTMEF